MKKLAIVQIVLGILVVGSLIFWAGWVSTGYYESVGTTPDGNIIHEMGLQKPNPLMDTWVIVYPVLGLSVLGCGIAQYFKARHQNSTKEGELGISSEKQGSQGMKLAITQVILGLLIVISLAWFIGWVEPDYGSHTRLIGGTEVEFHPLPGWLIRLISWKAVSFVLGLSVIGCGIAQFVKARHPKTAMEDELESGSESKMVGVSRDG